MTFLVPGALFGLLLLPVLWLLHRWRNRPRQRDWPSLVLWERIGEEAARRSRPRLDRLLLFESIAVALLSVAASEPVLGSRQVVRVVVHVDTGPHMEARRADGRTAMQATRDEIRRVRTRADEVVEVAWRGAVADGLIATGRDVLGAFGYAAQGVNFGIGAVVVRGEKLWFTVETDGPPADVDVRIGAERRTVRTGTGVEAPFAPAITILTADNLDADDSVALRRLQPVAWDETGSREVRTALFEAGLRAVEGADGADLVVQQGFGARVAANVRGSDCIAHHELFEGLVLDECRWPLVREVAGPPALTWHGRTVASFTGGVLTLGMPVDRPWDTHGTLAVLIEHALRAAVRERLGPDEALVGDAIADPAPRFVDTRGVDRPWDGTLPPAVREGGRPLRRPLALLAAGCIAVYLLLLLKR